MAHYNVSTTMRYLDAGNTDKRGAIASAIAKPLQTAQATCKRTDAENKETPPKCGVSSRSHPDLNWGMVVLQTTALPLGYGSVGESSSTPATAPELGARATPHALGIRFI